MPTSMTLSPSERARSGETHHLTLLGRPGAGGLSSFTLGEGAPMYGMDPNDRRQAMQRFGGIISPHEPFDA